MMRLTNAPAELLEKIAAHVGVQVIILDPDWNYVGFEEIPVPEDEQQAAEIATYDFLNTDDSVNATYGTLDLWTIGNTLHSYPKEWDDIAPDQMAGNNTQGE